MIERNLKVGDALIVKGNRVVLLTKKTKKYWYYFLDGHTARISAEKLWNYIDFGDNHHKVHYNGSLKNRHRHRTGRTLDLHGEAHETASERIRQYLNFVELPTSVITGDSGKMKKIVCTIVKEYGWKCKADPSNAGRILITEK